MERGYSSILTKNALAYNLAYHLKDRCGIENAHEVVISVLTSFEYKEQKDEPAKENQE